MWKLFHKLFGWHYAEYRDSCVNFVTRVRRMPNGTLWMDPPWPCDHYRLQIKEGKLQTAYSTKSITPLTYVEDQEVKQ